MKVCLNLVNRDQETDSSHEIGIQLLIKDNGIGFDETIHRGLGLLGMCERVEALKGTFVLNSAINEGVEIIVSV